MDFNPLSSFEKKSTQPEEEKEEANAVDAEGAEDTSTFEEDFDTLKEKKRRIEELQNRRRQYIEYSKQLKEDIADLGVSDEKRQEIYQKIDDQQAEIAATITDLRERYGLEPTRTEVLANRWEVLYKEAMRLKENLQVERQQLRDDLHKFAFSTREGNHLYNTHIITESLQHRYGNLAIIDEISRTLPTVNRSNDNKLAELLEKYADEVEKERQDRLVYTPEEESEKIERLDQVGYLADMTEKELDKLSNDQESSN